jgi:hypothetical protein
MFAPAYMGRKRCFECFYSVPKPFSLWNSCFCAHGKSFRGATPRRFRPTYAEANVGHPSGPSTTA